MKSKLFAVTSILATGCVAAVLIAVATSTAQDKSKIAAGAEVYAERCAVCHGERMRATGANFDLLQLGPNERARFDKAVNDGKGQMPPWGGVLSDEEIDQIWWYLRSRAD